MNLITAFSAPIWQSEYPDFNEDKEELIKSIREYREKNPEGERVSNIGGWQSNKNFHHFEKFSKFFDYICSFGQKCAADLDFPEMDIGIVDAWININDHRGCINKSHSHGGTFSGVFYLSCPDGSGDLCIPSPIKHALWYGTVYPENKSQYTATEMTITPEDGMVILWPSYLEHSVFPNAHDDERISISFNIDFAEKGSLYR